MLITALLCIATLFVAYANGANDNFKGVATLFGSGTTDYGKAIWWATITTFAGSVSSIFLAQTLVKNFSGKGLVPDAVIASPDFLLAVAIGAGLTVMLATVTGFPVSTTHGLTGALVGSGLVAVGTQVNFAKLGGSFFLPLLVSPLIAVCLGSAAYLVARGVRIRLGVTKEWCLCVGETEQVIPISEPGSVLSLSRIPLPDVTLATQENCTQRYQGKLVGINYEEVVTKYSNLFLKFYAEHDPLLASFGVEPFLEVKKRVKSLLDEVAKGVPVGELVIALGDRGAAALHDDEFDELLLEVVVFAETQGTPEKKRRARLPFRYGDKAIYIFLCFRFFVFQGSRQTDGYEC